jgi:hypothetical protein
MNLSQLKEQVRNILRERSVKAIQKEYSNVVDDIQKHLELYKKSKGTPEEKKHVGHLKTLGEKKKKLQVELDLAVAGLYKNAELKVDEAITNPKKTNPSDLAKTVLGWFDFYTDYIDDGGQRRRAIKSNDDVLVWFGSHPKDIKEKAYKIMLSQSKDKGQIERNFGKHLKESVNEGKYYVTYNRGRGQGKGLEMQSDPKTFKPTGKPKVFSSYNDAKKYAEKMEKMFRNSIGGSTAYWVSDEKMNKVEESVNESDLKGYLVADVVDDIVKSIGTRFVSGEIKQSNKNKIYLKLKDVKFGSGVVKILKSRFGIDAKEEMFGGKDKFGSIPSVSFFANKVVSESVNEEKVYIDYLNKAKGFKQDRIKFNSYEDAVKWARQNFDKFSPDMIKYESINEGRELKSIQSDLNKTIVAIQSEISSYKATKGTPQEKKHIDNLKKLHPIKKKLESELESAVSGLYKDAELKIED